MYQIEFQTRHEEMAIRFARYGIEYGISNKKVDPKTKAYKIQIPEQSVIYLENDPQTERVNKYEFYWKEKSLGVIDVKELKLWEITMKDILEEKLYNLLPIVIFRYRLELKKASNDKSKLQQIKERFLAEAKEVIEEANKIRETIEDEDLDLIVMVLGEMVRYFDKVFYDGEIERSGEVDMTFADQIKGYRQEINKYMQEVKTVKQEAKQEIKIAKQEAEKVALKGKNLNSQESCVSVTTKQ